MRARTFFLGAAAGAAALLAAAALLVAVIDPFFAWGIAPDETAVFSNQRYEMAGLIRCQRYDAVVMGTSLAANYRASWFTEGSGQPTLKITFPDGWISEFDTALELAFRTHKTLKTVWFCLDPNILIRSDAGRTVELPGYLYNDNPFDDVSYYLNADTCVLAVRTALMGRSGQRTDLDSAYIWDTGYTFSRGSALAGYPRPEPAAAQLSPDAYLDSAEENLDVVCAWAQAHPDTQFVIWFPPYSILYWDKMTREGAVDAVLSAVDRACVRLSALDNVSLRCFLDSYDVITDLDNYTDHIHCSSAVTHWVADQLLSGGGLLTPEDRGEVLDGLREFVRGYDYDAIFGAPRGG